MVRLRVGAEIDPAEECAHRLGLPVESNLDGTLPAGGHWLLRQSDGDAGAVRPGTVEVKLTVTGIGESEGLCQDTAVSRILSHVEDLGIKTHGRALLGVAYQGEDRQEESDKQSSSHKKRKRRGA